MASQALSRGVMVPASGDLDGAGALFEKVAAHSATYRQSPQPLHPQSDHDSLKAGLAIGLPERGRDAESVIADLIRGATPGLVGSTQPGFHAWVIGSSHEAGVAADWLASAWGQNSAIYQTSPAAAVAEEVALEWLVDLLGLPHQSSATITSGATMAGFICLAAARGEVLRRAGCDVAVTGLQGAPEVAIFISAESHESNFSALRFLGFGERDLRRIPADRNGVMDTGKLEAAMSAHGGPAIVVAQAGHIHTGAFDRFRELSRITRAHEGWLHVDGAFGLWARTAPEWAGVTDGVDLADSWSVDGHKWLQVPYDCGFAIVRHADAHRRAMALSAGYLPRSEDSVRDPNDYSPELSRRARGFAVWAVMQALGREGIADLVRQHCDAARHLSSLLASVTGLRIEHDVVLNQVAISCGNESDSAVARDRATQALCDRLNESGTVYLRTAEWRGRTVLRFSFSGIAAEAHDIEGLVTTIERELDRIGCR